MRFYQDDKPGRVWNPGRNRVGAAFVDGIFDTEDTSIIELLVAGEYRTDEPLPKQEDHPVKRGRKKK